MDKEKKVTKHISCAGQLGHYPISREMAGGMRVYAMKTKQRRTDDVFFPFSMYMYV